MILAAWLSILGALLMTSFCQAMAPPVAVALEAARNDQEVAAAASAPHDDALAVPEKRLLKYFLPAAQGWGSNDLPYVAQEGAKRGYSDRNFLRFGRGVDKRAKNFLRFGRGQNEDYDEEDMEEILTIPAEKRNKNFLRFGRDRNFLRFGRAGGDQVTHEAGPLEFAHDLKVEEPSEEEIDPYLREARGNNFLRFGRNYNKNFLRFGRSVDSQTYCEDCDEEETLIEQSSAPSSSSSSTVTESQDVESNNNNNKQSEAGDASSSSVASKSSTEGDSRSKRAVSVYHDYAKVPSRGPASWARAFPKPDEDDDDDDDEGYASRSPYNKDSWHFGSDHLYRFGKKRPTSGSSNSKDSSTESPAQSAKKTKTHNAIRFG